jgi:hypothetical protein
MRETLSRFRAPLQRDFVRYFQRRASSYPEIGITYWSTSKLGRLLRKPVWITLEHSVYRDDYPTLTDGTTVIIFTY